VFTAFAQPPRQGGKPGQRSSFAVMNHLTSPHNPSFTLQQPKDA
jgi:hypothetical protein